MKKNLFLMYLIVVFFGCDKVSDNVSETSQGEIYPQQKALAGYYHRGSHTKKTFETLKMLESGDFTVEKKIKGYCKENIQDTVDQYEYIKYAEQCEEKEDCRSQWYSLTTQKGSSLKMPHKIYEFTSREHLESKVMNVNGGWKADEIYYLGEAQRLLKPVYWNKKLYLLHQEDLSTFCDLMSANYNPAMVWYEIRFIRDVRDEELKAVEAYFTTHKELNGCVDEATDEEILEGEIMAIYRVLGSALINVGSEDGVHEGMLFHTVTEQERHLILKPHVIYKDTTIVKLTAADENYQKKISHLDMVTTHYVDNDDHTYGEFTDEAINYRSERLYRDAMTLEGVEVDTQAGAIKDVSRFKSCTVDQ